MHEIILGLLIYKTFYFHLQIQIFYLKNRDSNAWADKVETTFNVDLKNVIDNARERLENNQNIIEGQTVDIKSVKATGSIPNKGVSHKNQEDKDKK